MRFSIVIPAYNEAQRIHSTLDKILAYFRNRGIPFEILVVDDGSGDTTVEEVELRGEPELGLVRLPSNRGKGAALRSGVAASRGDLVLITDADLAIPIEELSRFESALSAGFDLACGSREHSGSRSLTRLPFHRVLMGKTFNWIVRSMGLSQSRDTQCGFKLFRGEAAREVFPRCRVNRFAVDVEALLVARRLGYRIVEVPVSWRHVPVSRVHLLFDSAGMLLDVIRIRFHAWRSQK